MMRIREDDLASCSPDDIRRQLISSGVLRVPKKVKAHLDRMGIFSAEDLVAILQTYPSSVSSVFRWSPDEVRSVTKELVSSGAFGAETEPRVVAFGAMDPRDE